MDDRTMQDAMLEGEAELRAALGQAEQEFTQASVVHQLGMVWSALPADAKEYVKQTNPDQYQSVSNFLKGK